MSENSAYFSHSSIFSKIGCMCSDLLETGGMYCRNGGYVLWICISCRNGGMCCRNGGVCVVEMWGMYISCKNGGLCCRNGVCVVEMGGMCCGNVG